MTARVLSDHFEQVTVLERDSIDARPVGRKSIPQGNHYHALLLGGQRVLSSLFPGFVDELRGLGAVSYRIGTEMAWFFPDGKAYDATGAMREPDDLGFDGYSQSRGLIEHCVRQCALEVPDVKFESDTTVGELVFEAGRVRGVRCETDGASRSLSADLVIDAGGRGTRATRWLADLGFAQPEETAIGVDFAYASTKFRIPDDYDDPERLTICFGPPPDYPDGAIMGEIEDRTWHVSLAGRFGNYPPDDEEGFLAFVRSIYTPRIYDLIKNAERVADIARYRFPTSVRRHYEGLTAFPDGFTVIGDAIASFNPVYGQGMSAAALQVDTLRGLLAERADGSRGLDRLALDFFPKAAEIVALPWTLAAAQDLAFPKTVGERPADLLEGARYLQALSELAADDIEIRRLLTEVFNLARPLSALMEAPLPDRVRAHREK
jgi:2-polyprenyl-6-methoxyphenol hydroxylase-like FAD-dependent oxidoreductase